MTERRTTAAIPWWEAEPARFIRDRDEITARFPTLSWQQEGASRWVGRLPMWPLERHEPAGLPHLLDNGGLEVEIAYRQAYPMVPPRIYPLDPQPLPVECTQHRWHVNGDGSLCQLQADAAWDPGDSICDLILKAAAWRIEYALMKAGAVEQMTLHGIVSDPGLDELITTIATPDAAIGTSAPEPARSAE